MPLTPEEQANVDAGLTTDGRPMEPCMCPDPEDYFWEPYEPDEPELPDYEYQADRMADAYERHDLGRDFTDG